MSVNFNRAEKYKCLTSKHYKSKYFTEPYWDEGFIYYNPKSSNWMYKRPNKRLLYYQVRMYKTWKHNRKTQWKT